MRERRPAGRALVLVGIGVLAFNLRPGAVSVGPVIDDIQAGVGMSSTMAGVLTSLPVIAFAVFGSVAPRLAGKLGPHRLALLALAALVAGLLGRTAVDDVTAFLGLSLLALAGMATGNVIMPSLVKRHFPGRVGLMTGYYSTAMAVGLTLASVTTVPAAEAYGGWRAGLAVWALTAAIAAVPWAALWRQDRRIEHDLELEELEHPLLTLREVSRTRLGWLMAVFFGLQSLQAYTAFGWFAAVYRDAGFSETTSGLLLGVITGVGIPLSILVPWLTGRMADVSALVVVLWVCYPIGYLGLILAPVGGAWLWAVLIGVGLTTFPMVLTLIGLRARTAHGTAALSGFTQSVGYLIAAVGPFAVGAVHDATGGWTVPLLLLMALAVPMLPIALAVARPRYVEDELAAGPSGR